MFLYIIQNSEIWFDALQHHTPLAPTTKNMRAKTLFMSWMLSIRSLGGTDDAFLAAYPAVNIMRVSDLLGAIRGKHERCRKSLHTRAKVP
jgi:hypothetical protein